MRIRTRIGARKMAPDQPETKMDEPVQVSTTPRARWRRIVLRALKYFVLTFLAITMCLTIFSWWRSYSQVDQLHGVLWNNDHRLLVTSIEGRFIATEYHMEYRHLRTAGLPADTGAWVFCTHPIHYIRGLHRSEDTVYWTWRVDHPDHDGWVAVQDLAVNELPPFYSMKLLWTGSRPSESLAYYRGLIVPHWMILVLCGTMFVLVLRGGRFSLRMLLVGVTLLCVLLATVVKIDRGYPEKTETRIMHEH